MVEELPIGKYIIVGDKQYNVGCEEVALLSAPTESGILGMIMLLKDEVQKVNQISILELRLAPDLEFNFARANPDT
jgi:hypothetical protein